MDYIGTTWKHVKTGGVYSIVGSCQLEATDRPAILYRSAKGAGPIWARDYEEFMDGRFLLMVHIELTSEQLATVKSQFA